MRRSVLIVFVLVVCASGLLLAQSPTAPRKLESIPLELEANPDAAHDPQWTTELDTIVQSATVDDVKRVLPAIVSLTESSHPKLRATALLVMFAIVTGSKDALTTDEAIVPYLPRLEPRLMDSFYPCRGMSLLLFQAFTAIRPVAPVLIQAALTVLKDPQSTHAMSNTTPGSLPRSGPSPGPQMLWILLPAAATFYLDPATNITEGRDSSKVQSAIIEFLHRSDQTTESLSESIRALTVSQVQNPDVNAALLPLLSSTDVDLQKALLGQLARLTFTPDDFASARIRVKSIATDPNSPADLQELAGSLLSCWSNDRHHGVCPVL